LVAMISERRTNSVQTKLNIKIIKVYTYTYTHNYISLHNYTLYIYIKKLYSIYIYSLIRPI